MNRFTQKMIAAVMCAAILTSAGCSISIPEQDSPAIPAVPDTPVSTADTNVDTVSPSDESEGKDTAEEIDYDCASGVHRMKTEGSTRTCTMCSYEVRLPAEMWSGYITEEATELEAGGMLFQLDEGIFVPGYLEGHMEVLVDTLEKVSGLSFTDALNNKKQVTVYVEKIEPQVNDGQLSESEVGGAWAASGEDRELMISAGDFFLGNSNALPHELSHILCFSQGPKYYCQLLQEGFAEYNCYKALMYLEENNPVIAYSLDHSYANLFNMEISEPEQIYAQSPEYWFENDFPSEYALNGTYALGFRFMAYLDNVYGDYSGWMHAANSMESPDNELPVDMQIESLRQTYGSDVLEGFYPWLKANEQNYAIDYESPEDYDLSEAEVVTLYPYFYFWNCDALLSEYSSRIIYDDLYIDLEEFRRYLSEYKNRSTDELILNIEWLEGSRTIELFDICGESLGVRTGETAIELDDVSFVRLCGEGVLSRFEITGFRGYEPADQ